MKNKNKKKESRSVFEDITQPDRVENVTHRMYGQYSFFNAIFKKAGEEIFSKMKNFYMKDDNIMWYIQEPDLCGIILDHISDEDYSGLSNPDQEKYEKEMVTGQDGWPEYAEGWNRIERSPFNKVIFKRNGQIFQITINKLTERFEIFPYVMSGFELSNFWKIRKIGKREISNLWKEDLKSLNLDEKITEQNISDMLSILKEDIRELV